VGPEGDTGPQGITGPSGPAGEAGVTVAFGTTGTAPNSTNPTPAQMKSAIEALKSPAKVNDVFWHIPTDRAFVLTNVSTPTFSEYNRVVSGGNIIFDGSNSRIIIAD